MIMYLDIETLPAGPEHEPVMKELYGAYLKKHTGHAGVRKYDDFVASTSFDGAFGRILCIGYALDEGEMQIIYSPDEKEMLKEFWQIAKNIDLFVGHNAFDFDIPFIWQRSIILGVEPSKMFSFKRFSRSEIFDTMQEWNLWGRNHSSGSLHKLALALKLPSSKGDIDGSQVYDYFKAGRVDEILEYCQKDVALTRKVFHKLTFGRYRDGKNGKETD
jgi:3'-5' exonuclease